MPQHVTDVPHVNLVAAWVLESRGDALDIMSFSHERDLTLFAMTVTVSFSTLQSLLVRTRCTREPGSRTLQPDSFTGPTDHGLDAPNSDAVKRES